jgi:hypothetical protein
MIGRKHYSNIDVITIAFRMELMALALNGKTRSSGK